MSHAIVVMLMLAGSPALAGQSIPTPRTSGFGVLRPSQSDPYKKLFEPKKSLPWSVAAPASKPKVVCGMTIIPADPTIDSKMRRAPKADGVDHKIRAIDPPVCQIPK